MDITSTSDIGKRAVVILTDAERRLRELVGSAAAVGDYRTTVLITDWARALGALTQGARQSSDSELQVAPSTANAAKTNPMTLVGNARGDSATGRDLNSRPARRKTRAPLREQYPTFLRHGDSLVKIGWSKKEKREYEHKASHRVVEVLVDAVASRFKNGKLFTAEDVFPLREPSDSSEIPGYQAYVALAWLRHCGLLKKHGRKGYSVASDSRLADAVAASWQVLQEATFK
jgi:hypothetical protein